MRCEARLAALTLFLSLGNASWLPQATPWAVNQVDDWGWTPKPTAAPDVRDRLPRYRLRRDSASFSLSSVADLSTVCGYEGTRPFICAASSSTSYYCATAASALDCCPLGVNSSLVECAVTSVCYNSAESAASCAVNGCNAATGVCTDPAYPQCVTFRLGTYSSFWCDSSATVMALSPFPFTPTSSAAASSSAPAITPAGPTLSSISTSTSPSAGVASLTSSAAPSPSHTSSPTSHVAEIVGGVIGGVAGLALIVAIIAFIIYRIRRKRAEASYDDAPEMSGATYNIG